MNQRIYDLYNANSFVESPHLRIEFPQILEAYFAEKKIIKDTNELDFEYIQSTSVKTEVYVVIKTNHFKGKKIRLNIIEEGNDHFVGGNNGVKILVEGKEVDFVEATVGEWDAGEMVNKELFENYAVFKLNLVRRRKGSVQWGNNVQVNKNIENGNRLFLVVDAYAMNTDFDDGTIFYYGSNNPQNKYLNRW